MRSARITYGVITVGAGLWCILLVAPSLLAAAGVDAPVLVNGVYQFFRPICHQMDERSWHLLGRAAAVCYRCSSIYFGFFAGALAYPFFLNVSAPVTPGRAVLFAAAIPMLLDVGFMWLGVYQGSTAFRVLTGGWFGVIVPFLIIPAAIEGVQQLLHQTSDHQSTAMKGTPDA
jgi:uncharacterized membrane protein